MLYVHSQMGDARPGELDPGSKTLKREVEFVRFPGESHELTRSGSPTHRVQRFEIVLGWLDRYLAD